MSFTMKDIYTKFLYNNSNFITFETYVLASDLANFVLLLNTLIKNPF